MDNEATRGQDHPSVPQDQKVNNSWRPKYLRLWVFLAFLTLFCAMIAALEVLDFQSRNNNGLATSHQSLHYSWTYGPTAILTIVVAIWSRVEFQAKRNAPWQGMIQAPEGAHRSVLLDYVSDIQPVALWASLKNRHFVVAASVAISLILRLLIVFSTGLLSLEGVEVLKPGVPVQLLNSFDASKASNFQAASSDPFYVINGVASQNLDYGDGTTSNLTFQQFSFPKNLPDAVLSVNVNALESYLDCEDADLISSEWGLTVSHPKGNKYAFDPLGETITNKLVTPSCTISNVSLDTNDKVRHGNSSIYIFLQDRSCDDGQKATSGERIVLTAVDMRVSKESSTYKNDHTTYTTTQNFTVSRSKQVLCKPAYFYTPVNVEVNTTQTLRSAIVKEIGPRSTLSNMTAWQIAKQAKKYGAPQHASQVTPAGQSANYYVTDNATMYKSMALAMQLAGFGNDTEKMFEGENLQLTVSAYYRAITAQLMNAVLTKQDNSFVTGNATVIENRLLVTQLSLRLMEACLAIVALLVIAIIVCSPKREVSPWNPHKLSSMTAVLAQSGSLHSLLHNTGAFSMETLSNRLADRSYSIQKCAPRFLITTSDETQQKEDTPLMDTNHEVFKLWKPFPDLIFKIFIFVVIALIIIVLEVTLHVSKTNDGLGDPANNTYAHYAWTLIPALIMVLIGLPIMSLDLNTKGLAPYFELMKPEGARFENFMNLDFLDNFSITCLLHAIPEKRFAILATTLATLIASILTIVTSGLFVSESIPFTRTMSFSQKTFFNHNASNVHSTIGIEDSDNVDMTQTKYILANNMTFPQWTYGSLAFPEIASKERDDEYKGFSSVEMKLPALTTALDCQPRTQSDLKPNVTEMSYGGTVFYINVELLMAPCNNKSATLEQQQVGTGLEPNSYFGFTFSTECDMSAYELSYSHEMAFIWGYFGEGNVSYISALQCTATAATVETDVRFTLPKLAIDPEKPPVVNESLVKAVKDFLLPAINLDMLSNMASSSTLGGFFQVMVDGKFGFPEAYLGISGKSNQVISAIKAQYGAVIAQILNKETRSPVDGTQDASTYKGNAINPNRLRVVQDAASTHTLVALLATMLVLSIIGSILMKTDGILPKNPGSIASMASLLADSNFLDRFRSLSAAKDPTDNSLGQTLSANCRFHLGWLDGSPSQESEESEESVGARGNEIFTIYLVDEGDKNRQ